HSLSQSFTSSAEGLRATISNNLKGAVADNASIYLEVVPPYDTLPTLSGTSIVKPIDYALPTPASREAGG
ncbi:unnamed protein product, partial [Discosporangium mesarthrocarpum]